MPRFGYCFFVGVVMSLGVGCGHSQRAPPPPLRVAAASDLVFAMPEVGELYQKATGVNVIFSFASSGALAKQIAEGAPFDVFASANVNAAEATIASGACLADSKMAYAIGELALYTNTGSSFDAQRVVDLADARVRKVAIAQPAHAPYGFAAKQALERAGVWNVVEPKLVIGESVQQAIQLAQSGNADVALVARSLAIRTPGIWHPVPADLFDSLEQTLVACTHGAAGPTAARRFASFMASADVRSVLERNGFAATGKR